MFPVEEHPRPYGFKRLLQAVGTEVSVEHLANDLGANLGPENANGERRGYGVCHGGGNPTALVVRPVEQRWYCFRCTAGGDVLNLWERVHGHTDRKLALMHLAATYNVNLPSRPDSYFERNRCQGPIRDALGRVKAGVLRRRLFRYTILPLIDATATDPAEHAEEVRRAWSEFSHIADAALVNWYERREADGS